MHIIICLLLFIGIFYQYNKLKTSTPIKLSFFEIFYGLLLTFEFIMSSFTLYKTYSNQMETASSIPEFFINGIPVATSPDLKPAMFFIALNCILGIIYFSIIALRYSKMRKLED